MGMSGRRTGYRAGRALSYPVRRLLDPRFTNVHLHVDAVDRLLRAEASAVRSELAQAQTAASVQALEKVDSAVARYAESTGEALAFVGSQLRELLDEVRQLEAAHAAVRDTSATDIAGAFAVRSLSRVRQGTDVLVVEAGEGRVGTLVATFGYSVLSVGAGSGRFEHPGVEHLDATLADLRGRTFGAVVSSRDAEVDDIRPFVAAGGVGVLLHASTEPLADARWAVFEEVHVREPLPGTWVRTESRDRATRSMVAATAS